MICQIFFIWTKLQIISLWTFYFLRLNISLWIFFLCKYSLYIYIYIYIYILNIMVIKQLCISYWFHIKHKHNRALHEEPYCHSLWHAYTHRERHTFSRICTRSGLILILSLSLSKLNKAKDASGTKDEN